MKFKKQKITVTRYPTVFSNFTYSPRVQFSGVRVLSIIARTRRLRLICTPTGAVCTSMIEYSVSTCISNAENVYA